MIPTSESRARGDVCRGSNSRTCPSEVEIATSARAEDEEGRDENEEGRRATVAALGIGDSGTGAIVREMVRDGVR